MKTTLREKQKQEAVKRLRQLKMFPNVIEDFEKEDRVYYSERINQVFDGVLYWLSNSEDFTAIVKDFEEKHEALVYHAQLTNFEFGKCLTLLFVSKHEKKWERDREDLQNGEPYCYVVNLDVPDFSEFGYCGIEPKNGGVTRSY